MTMYYQPHDDLLRLVATIRTIEASDRNKALVCRELLTKLGRYVGSGADDELSAVGSMQTVGTLSGRSGDQR